MRNYSKVYLGIRVRINFEINSMTKTKRTSLQNDTIFYIPGDAKMDGL